ncbi:hypothetical protein [Bacillus thuringiensis]|uniref:Lipoprotein n=1 Tax=Bacillus thuringiensis TaxID=1428 RepID=A0A9X6VCR9_BACTU|nr:hypothetical protein [Bacillus thuringiensis]MEC3270679.1 hypothetical protein [Bacillus thuringiensis]PFB08097.1 hypothetical protein CN398_10290 [Bacillus thuringiensis]
MLVSKMSKPILVTCLVASMLVGCGTKTTEKLNDKEQASFVNDVNKMVSNRGSGQEVESTFKNKIMKLDKKHASDVLNAYMFSVQQDSGELKVKMGPLQPDLLKVMKDKKVDVTKHESIDKLDDGLVKGLLAEAEKLHLKVKQDKGSETFYLAVDYQYVLDNYGKYMDDDLKTFLQFNKNQSEHEIFDSKNEEFNLKEIASQIKEIEKNESKWKDGNYKESWANSGRYLYSILLGVDHTFFVEDGKMKPNIKKEFESIIKENKGTQVAKMLKDYLSIIEKQNGQINEQVKNEAKDLSMKPFSTYIDIEFGTEETSQQMEVPQENKK